MVDDQDSVGNSRQRDLLEIDFNSRPCASYGDLQFDVPSGPFGKLKKTLRTFLRGFPDVEAAYMLLASRPEWGAEPHLTIPLVTERELDPIYRAWEAEQPGAAPIWFLRLGNNAISAFVRPFSIPFYVRKESGLPAPPSLAELQELIQTLPEVPQLAATVEHFESLKETYDHLPPEQAEAEYREQDRQKTRLLEDMRAKSTHGAARTALLQCLSENTPFSLLLRTFDREVASGSSRLTDGQARLWLLDRPLERHIAQVTPLKLIGIANPRDPFPPSDYLLLELGDDWLKVVVALVARAAAIFLICDRLSPGVSQELLVIQEMEREDDTFIIVPAEDTIQQEKAAHFFKEGDEVPLNPAVMRRRLATFGITATSTEFMEMPRYQR